MKKKISSRLFLVFDESQKEIAYRLLSVCNALEEGEYLGYCASDIVAIAEALGLKVKEANEND